MKSQSLFMRIGNGFNQALLASPLHGLMSASVLLIAVTGRQSGRTYTTPVNFVREGERLTITSLRERTWWRNLRGGAPVRVRLQGREVEGWATVAESESEVAAGLATYLNRAPQYSKFYGVKLDADGRPNVEDVARAAQTRVVIQIKLGPAPA